MIFWIDAQLPPSIAAWIGGHFPVTALAVRDLGLRDASDEAIFKAARDAGVCVVTKDADFVRLLERFGSPPKILWLTCGNTSNTRLVSLLKRRLPIALDLLETGEKLVEISAG